jgi:hypothetical protein
MPYIFGCSNSLHPSWYFRRLLLPWPYDERPCLKDHEQGWVSCSEESYSVIHLRGWEWSAISYRTLWSEYLDTRTVTNGRKTKYSTFELTNVSRMWNTQVIKEHRTDVIMEILWKRIHYSQAAQQITQAVQEIRFCLSVRMFHPQNYLLICLLLNFI